MIKFKSDSELMIFENISGTQPSKKDSGDKIELVKNYVYGLDESSALQSLNNCSDVRGFSVFFLGGVLKAIRDNGWFKGYGYSSFKTMVEGCIGLSQSTAYDYIKIYSCLIESGVSWSDINHIGWTKIRWFAQYLTPENASQWIQEAEEKNVEELKKFIKSETHSASEKAVLPKYASEPTPDLSTQVDSDPDNTTGTDDIEAEVEAKAPLVTEVSALDTAHIRQFKLFPEQEVIVNLALDHVKEELKTENNGVALEGVCIAYLRDNVGVVK